MERIQCSIHSSSQIDKTATVGLDPAVEESEIVEDLVSTLVTGLNISQDEYREKKGGGRIWAGSLSTDRKFENSNGGSLETSQFVVLNSDQHQKIQDNKDADERLSLLNEHLKSPSFPGSTPGSVGVLTHLDVKNTRVMHAEASGQVDAYDQRRICYSCDTKNSVVLQSEPFPIKSALWGSHDELRLAPRPKHHVTWAPDVREPACTGVSHTVSHSCHLPLPKPREHRHGHKGKSRHGDGSKNRDKKHSYKSRFTSQTSLLRARHHYVRYVRDWHLGCLEVSDDECIENNSTVVTGGLLESKSSTFHNWVASGRIVSNSEVGQKNCIVSAVSADQGSLNVDFRLHNNSKCAGSFCKSGGLPYKLLYGEAM